MPRRIRWTDASGALEASLFAEAYASDCCRRSLWQQSLQEVSSLSFTHLHLHTQYSLLDGSGRIPELISHAKELGQDSIAITDHGAMYGVIDFYKEAKKQGIKPILGCEVYVTGGSRFDKEKNANESLYHHLVLLCENNEGYHNLMKLVSRGFTEGYYYRPRVDMELLRRYHKGLIASSACLAGEIPKLLIRNMYDEAREAALRYVEIFGEGNFFLELQDHGYEDQRYVNPSILRLSKELSIPLIATNDVHYTYKEDAEAHDILLCIQTGKKVADKDRMRYPGGQFYLKSEEEMRELFKYAPEAIDNTQRIAERCNVDIEFGVTKLPHFDVPGGYDAKSYLRELCYKGLEERYGDRAEELKERLFYELSVIERMGYVDYFLIVSDFINYAKKRGIPVGPGRGSAAGSIVAYALKITNIDPIKYDLLFERFLNPERVSMPDIDVDFCYERREEVIDYVVNKYGHENVAQIITFGTLAARGVVRDVGRVLDINYAECDRIAKMIPQELGMTLTKALETPDLKLAYQSDERIKYLIDMSLRLEGLPRHSSTHAAGVLIAAKNVDEYVPLSRNPDGTIVTQFGMVTLEELGLLKMDFLGLRTLTVIKNAVDQIEKNHGVKIDIDALDEDDKNIFDMISRGDTVGIFQLESAGMTSFMKELKPSSIDDIIAGIALYRPGPMDFIPRYIKGKKNASDVSYECRELEPILKSTYGCIVYQEQVMQIVQSLAGYSLGRADLVRRAMSKKKASVMLKERQYFVYGNPEEGVKGCIANGIPEDVANHIFDEMTDFASYAFNKSHAACYAVVAYQTAWLKFYYPAEFMAALMTSVVDMPGKISEYIITSRAMGLKLLPPDINEGSYGFTADKDGNILFGLSSIKSIGRGVVDDIVREREQGGRFTDFEDLIERLPASANKKVVENFIKAGAFDKLPGNRHQKLIVAEKMLENAQEHRKSDIAGQMSLFDLAGEEEKSAYKVKLPEVEEFDKDILLQYEKEAVGIYLSGHPMENYMESIRSIVNAYSSQYYADETSGGCELSDGQQVVSGGIVTEIKTKITKNNAQMAFITLEDIYGQIDVVVFPKVFEKYRACLYQDSKVYVKGHTSIGRDDNASLIADEITPFDMTKKRVWIAFADKAGYDREKSWLSDLCFETQGNAPVSIYLRRERAMKELPPELKVEPSEAFMKALRDRLGAENVRLSEKL